MCPSLVKAHWPEGLLILCPLIEHGPLIMCRHSTHCRTMTRPHLPRRWHGPASKDNHIVPPLMWVAPPFWCERPSSPQHICIPSSHQPRRQPDVVHVQVYYSPAFLRLSNDNLFAALRVLACVYRAARSLFPLCDADSKDTNVCVFIDKLNAAGPADSLCSAIGVGQLWLLVRTGDCEAVVQRYSLLEHSVFEPPTEAYRVLHITTSLLSTA